MTKKGLVRIVQTATIELDVDEWNEDIDEDDSIYLKSVEQFVEKLSADNSLIWEWGFDPEFEITTLTVLDKKTVDEVERLRAEAKALNVKANSLLKA